MIAINILTVSMVTSYLSINHLKNNSTKQHDAILACLSLKILYIFKLTWVKEGPLGHFYTAVDRAPVVSWLYSFLKRMSNCNSSGSNIWL